VGKKSNTLDTGPLALKIVGGPGQGKEMRGWSVILKTGFDGEEGGGGKSGELATASQVLYITSVTKS